MDFKTFLEHFDTIAQAPNGIPKLRSLILDLAVRGKLVPQNLEEEPASKLLQKVQSNKQYLLEHNKLHQKKAPRKINKDEVPHYLPEGWIWCRFGHIIDCYRGHNPPKLEFVKEPREGYVRFIQITDFKTDEAAVYVPVSKSLKYVYKGEIAMAAYRHIGKLSRNVEGAFNVAICKVIEIEPISRDYLEKLIGSVYVKGELLAASGRAHIPSMHTEHLLSLVIPLPPLAEQKRIVEKVDELMALCDRLQSSQQTQDNLRQKLRESAIASLMNATTDDELKQSWAIARENWHTLSQKPEDVNDLRRAILQLAMRGKLAPQDLEDEPSSVLLNRINSIRAETRKGSKINFSSEKNIDLPELPKSWIWCKVEQIANVCLGSTPSREEPSYWNGHIPWVSSGEVANCRITSTRERITNLGFKNSSVKIYPKGTVLIAIIGQGKTRGQSAVLDIEACTNQNVAGLVFDAGNMEPDYVWKWALSEYENTRSGGRGGAQPALNGQKIKNLLIPVPPLAEQKRIVAKVDELMQMCDQLEENLCQSQQKLEALVASAISHLQL